MGVPSHSYQLHHHRLFQENDQDHKTLPHLIGRMSRMEALSHKHWKGHKEKPDIRLECIIEKHTEISLSSQTYWASLLNESRSRKSACFHCQCSHCCQQLYRNRADTCHERHLTNPPALVFSWHQSRNALTQAAWISSHTSLSHKLSQLQSLSVRVQTKVSLLPNETPKQ